MLVVWITIAELPRKLSCFLCLSVRKVLIVISLACITDSEKIAYYIRFSEYQKLSQVLTSEL